MRLTSCAAAIALLLCSCGPKALELPSDPIDRAATCGVVAAATSRTATNIQQSLPFDAQLHIFHYALLAGSEGGSFSPETASTVSKRMSDLQEGITKGKWQDLAPACAGAYPEAQKTDVALPAGFDTQLGCDALADFVLTALRGQEADYGNELASYNQMRTKLNRLMAPAMISRAGKDVEAQQTERHKALATMAKLGAPSAVLKQCVTRFG